MKTLWAIVGRKEDGKFLVSMSKMTKIPKEGKVRTHWVSECGVLLEHNKSTDVPMNKRAFESGKGFVFLIVAKSSADAQRLLHIANNVGEGVLEFFCCSSNKEEPKTEGLDLFGHLKTMQSKLDKVISKLDA